MTIVAGPAVEISAADLPVEDLLRIAHGAQVALATDAIERIRASRAIVDALVDGPALIYGLNTGLGHLRDERVPRETLRRYQELIVAGHEGAIGDPLPATVVRAAMAVRLNGIARGGAGASLPVAQGLAALLNAGVTPVVAHVGSVGASDLMHMAAIAQVLIGQGRADLDGEILSGAEALRRAGLEPVVLEPKDGLALISANGVAIGQAALVAEHAARLARVADLVLAASLEVMSGNPSVLDPAVLAAKPVPGQLAAGADVRAFLDGSGLFTPGVPRSVQDPLSFRVGPQVHGAFREFIGILEGAVAIELNAMDDNPLVDVESGRILSNGNFHPMALALALDALRPAIAHVGQLADRRLNHLWTGLAALFMSESIADLIEQGGGLLRYTAATRYSELRLIAGPATLDIGALDLGVEDHATNAPLTAQRSEQALGLLQDILSIELLTASTMAVSLPTGRPTPAPIAAAFDVVRRVRAPLGHQPPAALVHAVVSGALSGGILDAALAEVGSGS
jgi:histidine ammonia-lyase